MSLSRTFLRDLTLPSQGGESELCPLSESQALEFVRRDAWRGAAPEPTRATTLYVRWKPGISSSTCYEVQFADNTTVLVTIKIYKADRIKHATRGIMARRGEDGVGDRLKPLVFIDGLNACMWTFPVDPVLRGLERARELRRIARQIDGLPGVAPWQMRLRASQLTTLRYKPERRAVLKLNARMRRGAEERAERPLVVRVHAPEEARRIHSRRLAAGSPVPVPLLWEDRTGLIIDPWLSGTTPDPLDFQHAFKTGGTLVPLHERPPSSDADARKDLSGLATLFDVSAPLGVLFAAFNPPPALPPIALVHGDIHPDQLLLPSSGQPTLLDWDSLRPGRPAEDIASWIADALGAESDSAGELIAGYEAEGGSVPNATELTECVRSELVERAAAAIRRLEAHAVVKARRLLELAMDPELGARFS